MDVLLDDRLSERSGCGILAHQQSRVVVRMPSRVLPFSPCRLSTIRVADFRATYDRSNKS